MKILTQDGYGNNIEMEVKANTVKDLVRYLSGIPPDFEVGISGEHGVMPLDVSNIRVYQSSTGSKTVVL